jgi:hypothetical protein
VSYPTSGFSACASKTVFLHPPRSPPLSTQSTPSRRRLLLDSSGTQGDTRAAKLVIDLGHKHIAPHQTLEELRGDRPLFTFTKEEAARIRKIKIMDGMVVPTKGDDLPQEDDDEGQPVL